MNINKDEALWKFIVDIKRSWTYAKMTEEEKDRCLKALRDSETALKGSARVRWEILCAVYHGFLLGLGYSGALWRATECEKESIPLF